MVAKVVARHRVDEAFDVIAALRVDAVPRVPAAASRALSRRTRRVPPRRPTPAPVIHGSSRGTADP